MNDIQAEYDKDPSAGKPGLYRTLELLMEKARLIRTSAQTLELYGYS
jgi:hypothetical protein